MKRLFYVIAVMTVCMIACEEYENGPLVDSEGSPGAISSIKVENLPGAARISYSLPDDPNALYVVAEFETDGKGSQEVKSSVYKNYMQLNGFYTTDERTVNLYVVNRSQQKSEPIEVTIKPLEAPIHFMFESMKIEKDFGGVNIKLTNETENEYVIYTLVKDSVGEWGIYDRNYTSMLDIDYSVHGLPSVETEFAFVVRDEWQNYSDTLYQTLTPIFEEMLDKTLWKAHPLDNDAYKPLYSNRAPSLMWDESISTSPYTTDPTMVVLPQWVTIDLGKPAVFSRGNVQGFYRSGNTSRVFSRETPKVYEIWGSNNPSQDGSWENWTLLVENTSVKPSGLPVGDITAEDLDAAIEGDNFSFSFSGTAYRYIRFKTNQTWGNQRSVMLGELTLWGQAQQ